MTNDITFSVLGITLSEPNLFITDMVIATVAFICFTKLRTKPVTNITITSYEYFFVYTALSAIISGFGHLFTFYTDQYLKMAGWIFSLFANGYIVKACFQFVANEPQKKTWNILVISKFIACLLLLLITQKFIIITVDTIISIALIALPFHFRQWQRTRNDGFKLFCMGVVFTMLTGIVGALKLSISDNWFNDKDINHLIISGGLLFIYNGVKKL